MATKPEERKINIILDGKQVNASLKEMEASAGLMYNQLRKMASDDPKRGELISQFKQLKDRIRENKDEVLGFQKASIGARLGLDGVKTGADLMKFSFKAAVAAFLPLLAFQEIVELGKKFLGLVDHVDQVKGSLQQLTGAEGEALDQMYIRAEAISKTFDKENQEVIKSANVMAKEFGISFEEAFDLIEKGFLAGGDASGEMLDQIGEYSSQFATAQLSAEDFVSELVKGEKAGIFSDKAADTVKEFGLRIREQTTATRDALDAAFGQDFTDKIFKGINDGSITTADALRQVSKQMNNTKVPAKELQTVVADVFGGPGEDAGIEYLKTLENIGGELETMVDKTNGLTNSQMEQLEAEKLLSEAQLELGETFSGTGATLNVYWTNIKTFGIQTLNAVILYFKNLRNEAVGLGYAIGSIGSSFKSAFNSIISGDFSDVADAFGKMGKNSSKAYWEGYMLYENKSKKEKEQLDKQAADKAAAEAVENGKKIAEATRKEMEAAAKKAAAEAEKIRKEEAAKLKKAREDYNAAVIKSDLELAKLKIEIMEEGVDKVLAKLKLQHDLEMKELEKRRVSIVENAAATETEKQAVVDQLRDQEKIKEEEYQKQVAQTKKEAKEKERDEWFTQLDEEEEYQYEVLQQKFMNAFDAEYQREQLRLDLKKQTLEQKMALLEEAGLGETTRAVKLKTELLKTDKEISDGKIENAKRMDKIRRDLDKMTMESAVEAFKTGVDLLEKDTAARKIAAGALKAFSLGKITIDMNQEIQAIWRTANENPANILFPGSGNLIAGFKTAAAVGRATLAMNSVMAQKFAGGGPTGIGGTLPMVEVNGMWEMASGYSGGTVGSFASGGHVTNARFGIIGEAGSEYVIPNWMLRQPKIANVVGWMESERIRGARTFADGGPTTGVMNLANGDMSAELLNALLMVNNNLMAMRQEVNAWQRDLRVNYHAGNAEEVHNERQKIIEASKW